MDRILQYANFTQPVELATNVGMLSDPDKVLLKQALNKDWGGPFYKLKYFQGHAQITKYAIFRQWMLELRNCEESIERIDYEIEKGHAELEQLEYIKNTDLNPGSKRLAEVEQNKLKRQIEKSTRQRNQYYTNRQQYLDLVDDLLNSPDGKLPDGSGRTWLDIMNSDEQDYYEKQIWTNRLGKQAALDILFYGRVGVGNMDAILQMPQDQQTETFSLATEYALELKNYQTQLQSIAVDKSSKGLPMDLKELKFPVPPVEQLTTTPISKIENTGDDLDVYNV